MVDLQFLDSALSMPLMSLPVRTVVIPTADGKVLFSPGSRLSEESLRSVGDVTDIVAPNLLHCGGVAKAARIHPKARVWGVPGAKAAKADLPWTHELTEASWIHGDVLRPFALEGIPKLRETVFLHRPSKTLLVADLCFNLSDAKGFGAWLILNMFGTYRVFGVSRFYAGMVKDRKAFAASMNRLLEADFDGVVMSHGQPLLEGAKEKLRESLRSRGLIGT